MEPAEIVDTALLNAARLRYSRSTQAQNTINGYGNGWKLFEKWCNETGRQALPPTDETVALYLTSLIESGRKISTCEHRYSAIRDHLRRLELPEPDGRPVRALITGARRALKELPKKKLALEVPELRQICECPPVSPFEIRNRAILLFGFATALRRSEIARMQLEDLDFSRKEGIEVHLRFEKQDQIGKGRKIAVCTASQPMLCPVLAIKRWLEIRGRDPGALFYQFKVGGRMTKDPLSPRGEAVAGAVKHEVERAGLDPAAYGAHSLRAGFITSAFVVGLNDLQIAAHTGHKNMNILRGYIRVKDPFANAASGKLGL